MKVFRIIPEFRILRLTFLRKSASKFGIRHHADYNSFSDIFTVYLKTINHLNLKYNYFEGILQRLKFEFQKFRILENFELHP